MKHANAIMPLQGRVLRHNCLGHSAFYEDPQEKFLLGLFGGKIFFFFFFCLFYGHKEGAWLGV